MKEDICLPIGIRGGCTSQVSINNDSLCLINRVKKKKALLDVLLVKAIATRGVPRVVVARLGDGAHHRLVHSQDAKEGAGLVHGGKGGAEENVCDR